MERVSVFLDYENVHRTGHERFAGNGTPQYETVVNPLLIAERLIEKRRLRGELHSVHVYRGRPVPALQPRPASANDMQTEAWTKDSRVEVVQRALKYDFDVNKNMTGSREKGIDVALAVGLVKGAMERSFDAAIVFTCDTDILPALELAYHHTAPNLEIACWSGAKPLWFAAGLQMSPPKRYPYCHFLDNDDFVNARDYSASNA